MADKKRRRLFRQGSCFCWQSCTKLFQNVWWCQGLYSFRLGLAFPLHVPTMTARVEGEGGWSVWEPAEGLFSPHSSLVLLQAVQSPEEEEPLRTWGMNLWTKTVCTDNVPLSSLPPNIRCKWLPIRICLLHQDSCRKAAENEAYGFVELEGKLSLLIFASALLQSHRERRPYLLVTKEVLTRPQVIPARPVQIKVCRAQSCEN